jgi:hypothetical protein
MYVHDARLATVIGRWPQEVDVDRAFGVAPFQRRVVVTRVPIGPAFTYAIRTTNHMSCVVGPVFFPGALEKPRTKG